MLDEIVITSVEGLGYPYQSIRQAFEVGKLPEYEEEERIIKKLKRESERIQPSSNSNMDRTGYNSNKMPLRYNSKGELEKEKDSGAPLDLLM